MSAMWPPMWPWGLVWRDVICAQSLVPFTFHPVQHRHHGTSLSAFLNPPLQHVTQYLALYCGTGNLSVTKDLKDNATHFDFTDLESES